MYIRTLSSLYTILSVAKLFLCASDDGLTTLVDLLTSSNTSCSDFSTTIKRYPNTTSKFINEQTLSKHYSEEIVKFEGFLSTLVSYLVNLDSKGTQISNSDYTKNIKFLLTIIKHINSSIKLVGACLKDHFIDSEDDKDSQLICKQSFRYLNISENTKEINGKHYNVYWGPVTCIRLRNSTYFPIRLIYNYRMASNTSIQLYIQFEVSEFKLNQCDTDLDHCFETTTKCIYNQFPTRKALSTGNYYCRCRDGLYINASSPNSNDFLGYQVEKEFLIYDKSDPIKSKYNTFNCQPCSQNCPKCTTGNDCKNTPNKFSLRALPLAFQSFCITVCIVTGIIVFQLRRTRVIKSSNWVLLELFLLGAIFIYCTIINAYFEPSVITCAIQPFLREGGFVLMYGVLYVKVYRVLCSFQSRKAQRVYVRDQDILRYLSVLVVICCGHLIAWIATSFDHKKNQADTPFFELRKVGANMKYQPNCLSNYWDMVSYLYEFGLLVLTIYYCKCVRSAPSEYGEVRFITIAVINELIISFVVIITKISVRDTVDPDYVFLIYFLHCHATTTISVGLVIGPKLWYLYRPPMLSANRPRLVPHSETHIIQTQQKLNGDVDLVEINLAEMDSETIRDELKRLYTQLEIYKTRAMRKDNPHVSRKRGGRKQRRFSLQHFHKKHHATGGHDDETSKISEDSGGNSAGEEANLTSTSTKLN